MVAPSLLLSYAYLKVNFDRSTDSPVDLMLPLSVRALATLDGPIVSPPDLQRAIKGIWGLDIPQNVIRFMFPKLAAQAFLLFENGAYRINTQKSKERYYQATEVAAQAIYQRVRSGIQRLIVIHDLKDKMNPDEVIERFLDTGGAAFLSTKTRIPYTDPLDVESNVIVAEYLGLDGLERRESNLKDIEALVIGDVLYKAISGLSEGDADSLGGGRMQAVQVYLDTPVIMRLLRYEDDDLSRPAQEMLQLAVATGCKLRVFSHTIEEVQNILRGSADSAYSKRQKSGLDERVIAKGIQRSDLIEDAQFLPQILADMGIEAAEPPALNKELSVSERNLDAHLQGRIGYKNPDAKIRDISSLTGIYRLRLGDVKRKLEDCVAIFITTNINLAAVATEFFAKSLKEDGKTNVVQHCMTDVIFTMRMWLKVPTKFENVPRSQLIAHSLSSLKPHNDLYEAFIRQLDRLVADGSVSDDEGIRARLAALVSPILMMETKGQVSALDEGKTSRIVAEVLDRQEKERLNVVRQTRYEERARADVSIKSNKVLHDLDISRLNDKISQEAAKMTALERTIAQLNAGAAETRAARDRVARSIASWAATFIKFIAICIMVALILFTAIDVFAGASLLEPVRERIGEAASHAALGLLAVALAALAFRGISYIDLANHVEGWVASRVLRLSKTLLKLD